MLRSTPMMAQGDAVVGSQLIGVVGNSGPVFQPCGVTAGAMLPDVIEPPPGVTPEAPVGILVRPKLLLKARNASQFTVSYVKPPPPRITVVPLPVGSHANPARGAKFLWLPL